jgi:NADP-dependent 3-hydroxy acid dehydrogenase YdfG
MQINPFNLKDKIILISGASSGIGRQCAINCSLMGATIALFGRDKLRLEETYNQMAESNKHLIYSVDLIEYEKVGLVEEVVSKGNLTD